MSPTEPTEHGPVIRDRRRIDPVTGKVRAAAEGSASVGGQPRPGGRDGRPPDASGPVTPGGTASPPGSDGEQEQAAQLLAERTADLQRVQAEYANYRKRVERDRLAVREQALANVLGALLPVLDDVGRAREHGELTGGFKSVAESLEGITAKLGLTSYGEVGDPFDPMLHEALMHEYSADVSLPTCVRVLQPGYRVGDRTIRHARVAVAEPQAQAPAEPTPAAAKAPGAQTASPGGDDQHEDRPGEADQGLGQQADRGEAGGD